MSQKLIAIMAMALGVGLSAFSSSLTPEQALAYALSQMQQKKPGMAASSHYSLAATVAMPNKSAAGVYVFNNTQREGFIVVSADDNGQALLGYSDSGYYDAENAAPALEWWISCYAAQVEQAAMLGAEAAEDAEDAEGEESAYPLIATQWHQTEPYNSCCPVVLGEQCPTGCVATALSQIMNYYQYPEHGTGHVKYKYTVNYTMYEMECDLDTIVFDWENMHELRDITPAPVAKLMHAVGMACNAAYVPGNTGASMEQAGLAMINNFGYSPKMALMQRKWYDDHSWADLVRREIAFKRPVYYSGVDADGNGHAFIVDGFEPDGFFHVNWGWGGMANGYFLLSALDPSVHGVGGGVSSYDFDQRIFVGLEPNVDPEDTELYTIMSNDEPITTDAESYERGILHWMKVSGSFANRTLGELNCALAFEMTPIDGGEKKYITVVNSYVMPFNTRLVEFNINTSLMPVGDWEMRLVYSAYDSEWKSLVTPIDLERDCLYVHVEKNSVQVFTEPFEGIESVEADVEGVEYYTLQGVKVASPGKGYYIQRRGNTAKVVRLKK